jgi:hypothetical protein
MRDFDGDIGAAEVLQQRGNVLHGHVEAHGQCRGGGNGRGCEHVGSHGRTGVSAPVGDLRSRAEPGALHVGEKLKPVRGLLAQRVQKPMVQGSSSHGSCGLSAAALVSGSGRRVSFSRVQSLTMAVRIGGGCRRR